MAVNAASRLVQRKYIVLSNRHFLTDSREESCLIMVAQSVWAHLEYLSCPTPSL